MFEPVNMIVMNICSAIAVELVVVSHAFCSLSFIREMILGCSLINHAIIQISVDRFEYYLELNKFHISIFAPVEPWTYAGIPNVLKI